MAKLRKIIGLHTELWVKLQAYADKHTSGNLTQAVEEILLKYFFKEYK